MLTDDTDDTKSSIPDIKRIPIRDKVAGEARPASVYDVPLKAALNSAPSGGGDDPRIPTGTSVSQCELRWHLVRCGVAMAVSPANTVRSVARRAHAAGSASISGAVGIIAVLMLAWGAIVATGLT